MPTPGQPLSVSSGDILSFVPTGCPPDRQMPLILYTAPAFAAIQRAPMSDDVQSPSPSPSVLTASSPDAESALTDAIDNDSIHTRAANKAGAEVTERPISLRSSSQDNDSVLATSPEPAAAFLDNGEITESDSAVNAVDYEYSNVRLFPSHTSSFLHAGSKFTGTQKCGNTYYAVDVDIKHVDMRESYLCGYLRIQGLAVEHPTLTTYFEGEMIGTKHNFSTRHKSWGATRDIDEQHWQHFEPYRTLVRSHHKHNGHNRWRRPSGSQGHGHGHGQHGWPTPAPPCAADFDFAAQDYIFMRWKEHFLVPDHRVTDILGASFEGFYYICFSQITGEVDGIYYHLKGDNPQRLQKLELRPVLDYGCAPALEFR